MLNVYMAVFWFVLGVVIIVVHYTTPDAPMRSIGNTGISPGWFCIFLGLFNTMRWWTSRYMAALLFVVGCGLIVYHYANENAPLRSIGNSGISPGWFCLLLSAYVMLRWYTSRSDRAAHGEPLDSLPPVDKRNYGTLKAGSPEYNPELDFTDRGQKKTD